MSYIHKALKKAEEEREDGYRESGHVSQVHRETARIFGGRPRGAGLIVLFIISFAVVSYLYWDSGRLRDPVISEPVTPEVVSPPAAHSVADAGGIYDRAWFYQKSGKLEDARRLYQDLLKVDPGHVKALNNLGVIYIRDREFSAARGRFEKAIRLRPGYVDPYYNLACAYALMDDLSQSIAYLKKAGTVSKSALVWARSDTDLKRLHGLAEFKEVVGNVEANGRMDEKTPE
jgi:tetratricopeptide (TPR) repeat protein